MAAAGVPVGAVLAELPDALDLDNWERASATGVDAFPEESEQGTTRVHASAPSASPKHASVPAALAAPGRSGRRIPPVALRGRGSGDCRAWRSSPCAGRATTPVRPIRSPLKLRPRRLNRHHSQRRRQWHRQPPPRAEISTLRQVWIRVTVDGQKVIERELPPNTRIPLNPASQFVVRAGDAGAVRGSDRWEGSGAGRGSTAGSRRRRSPSHRKPDSDG